VIEQLFSTLSHALNGAPALALLAAFAWGVLSLLLSPCHLASLPLIIGFVNQQRSPTTRRAFLLSCLFALGILLTLALIGLATAAAGRILGDIGAWSTWLVAAILIVVGLYLLDVVQLPWSGPSPRSMPGRGPLAAFSLGLLFGLALGPCTFAYMAPMLSITFALAASQFGFSLLLLAAYGVGHCAIIVIAGTATGSVQRYLDWQERSPAATRLKRGCGGAVLLAALWLLYTAQ